MPSPLFKAYVELSKNGLTRTPIPVAFLVPNFVAFDPTATSADLKIEMGLEPEVQAGINPTNSELEIALKRLRINVRINVLDNTPLHDVGVRLVLLNDGDLAASVQGTAPGTEPVDFAVVEYRTNGQPMARDIRFQIQTNSINIDGAPHDEIFLKASTPNSSAPATLVGGMVTGPIVIRDCRNWQVNILTQRYSENPGKLRAVDLGALVDTGSTTLPLDALWATIDVSNPTPTPTSLSVRVATPVTADPLDAPSLTASGGGQLPAGHYQYAVSAEYVNGNESSPGDAATAVVASPGGKVVVDVGEPTADEDPQLAVTRRHVYRTGPGTTGPAGDWLRVGTIEGTSAGSLTDTGAPGTPMGFSDDRSRLAARYLRVTYSSTTTLWLDGNLRLIGRDGAATTDDSYIASLPQAPLELAAVFDSRAGALDPPQTRLRIDVDAPIPVATIALPRFGSPFDIDQVSPPGNIEVHLRDTPTTLGLDWLSIGSVHTRISAGATHLLDPTLDDPAGDLGLVGVTFGQSLTVGASPNTLAWPDNEPAIGGDITLPTPSEYSVRHAGSARLVLRQLRWGVFTTGSVTPPFSADVPYSVTAWFPPNSGPGPRRRFPARQRDLRARLRQHQRVMDLTARSGKVPQLVDVGLVLGDTRTLAMLRCDLERVRVAGRLDAQPTWLDDTGHRSTVDRDDWRQTIDVRVPRLAAGTEFDIRTATSTATPSMSAPPDAEIGPGAEEHTEFDIALNTPRPLHITAGVNGLATSETLRRPSPLDAVVEARLGKGTLEVTSRATQAGVDESGPGSPPTDETTSWRWSTATTKLSAPGSVTGRVAIRRRDRPSTRAGGSPTGPWVALRATPQVQIHQGGPRPDEPIDAGPDLDAAALRLIGLTDLSLLTESRPTTSQGDRSDSATDVSLGFRAKRANSALHVGAREQDPAHPAGSDARRVLWARCASLPDHINASILSLDRRPGESADDGGAGIARVEISTDRAWSWHEVVAEPSARRRDPTRHDELGSVAGIDRIELDTAELPPKVSIALLSRWRGLVRRGLIADAARFPDTKPPPATWIPGGASLTVDGPLAIRWLRMITWDGECADPFWTRPTDGTLPTSNQPVRAHWGTVAVPDITIEHETPGAAATIDIWTFAESIAGERPCVYDGSDDGAPKAGVGFRIGAPLTVAARARTFRLFAPFDHRFARWDAIPTTDPSGYSYFWLGGGGGFGGPPAGPAPSLTTWRMGVDLQMKGYRGEITIRPEEKQYNPFGDWEAGPGEWFLESSDQIAWPVLFVIFDVDSGHTFMGNTGNGFRIPPWPLPGNGVFSTLQRIYNWTYTP